MGKCSLESISFERNTGQRHRCDDVDSHKKLGKSSREGPVVLKP